MAELSNSMEGGSGLLSPRATSQYAQKLQRSAIFQSLDGKPFRYAVAKRSSDVNALKFDYTVQHTIRTACVAKLVQAMHRRNDLRDATFELDPDLKRPCTVSVQSSAHLKEGKKEPITPREESENSAGHGGLTSHHTRPSSKQTAHHPCPPFHLQPHLTRTSSHSHPHPARTGRSPRGSSSVLVNTKRLPSSKKTKKSVPCPCGNDDLPHPLPFQTALYLYGPTYAAAYFQHHMRAGDPAYQNFEPDPRHPVSRASKMTDLLDFNEEEAVWTYEPTNIPQWIWMGNWTPPSDPVKFPHLPMPKSSGDGLDGAPYAGYGEKKQKQEVFGDLIDFGEPEAVKTGRGVLAARAGNQGPGIAGAELPQVQQHALAHRSNMGQGRFPTDPLDTERAEREQVVVEHTPESVKPGNNPFRKTNEPSNLLYAGGQHKPAQITSPGSSSIAPIGPNYFPGTPHAGSSDSLALDPQTPRSNLAHLRLPSSPHPAYFAGTAEHPEFAAHTGLIRPLSKAAENDEEDFRGRTLARPPPPPPPSSPMTPNYGMFTTTPPAKPTLATPPAKLSGMHGSLSYITGPPEQEQGDLQHAAPDAAAAAAEDKRAWDKPNAGMDDLMAFDRESDDFGAFCYSGRYGVHGGAGSGFAGDAMAPGRGSPGGKGEMDGDGDVMGEGDLMSFD